ncbi:MAG: hypothetical protein NT034_01365 [Candidatus Magasanikbacteria bacterium]|nr:hypothetical protein [Candidatus Magasanikbacteria bacterium]
MIKKVLFGFVVAIIILLGWEGYSYYNYKNNNSFVVGPAKTISYLVSPEETIKYCNGVDMDSDGYRSTITQEKTTFTTEANPTTNQIIKSVVNAATTGMCNTVLNQLNITEKNGIVTIPTIEGWAGISITMCSCKPQVEVNLLRLPGITNVVWDNSPPQTNKSGVKGVVTLGPTCPVERIPPVPACASKPYQTQIQVMAVGSSKNSPFTTVDTNASGEYSVSLPPGKYALQPVGGSVLPRCETKEITVVKNIVQEINLICDTGIR